MGRYVEMIEGSREGFFSIGVTIDDLKEVGNLEVARKRLIKLRMMGYKKEERSLRIFRGIRSREQENEDTDLMMEMRSVMLIGEK